MSEKIRQASEYFDTGMNCAQSVLGTFCEDYGLDRDIAFRISCGLGSGARCAEICGAVSGPVLVIGLKYGTEREKCNLETEEFIKRFKAENVDVTCKNLLGCDVTTPDGREKAVTEMLFDTKCVELVENATQILVDMGY